MERRARFSFPRPCRLITRSTSLNSLCISFLNTNISLLRFNASTPRSTDIKATPIAKYSIGLEPNSLVKMVNGEVAVRYEGFENVGKRKVSLDPLFLASPSSLLYFIHSDHNHSHAQSSWLSPPLPTNHSRHVFLLLWLMLMVNEIASNWGGVGYAFGRRWKRGQDLELTTPPGTPLASSAKPFALQSLFLSQTFTLNPTFAKYLASLIHSFGCMIHRPDSLRSAYRN